MKKYFAKEVRGNYMDYEMYFDEEDAKSRRMWIGGNSDFVSINKSLFTDTARALENIYYDLEGEETLEEARAVVECYLKPAGDRTEMFSDDEIERIIKCAKKYDTFDVENEEVIAEALGIIYGEEFVTGTFRGCVQLDWIRYICPKTEADCKEKMGYIEAVYFGTGTEFFVTQEKVDSADDFDEVDAYSFYTAAWSDEKVKEDLAKQMGCAADEIVLLKVKEEHHYIKYDYEEV